MAIPRNEEEAARFLDNVFAPWRDQLIASAKGTPKPILANAITAFQRAPEWAGILQYDQFKRQTVLRGCPPWSEIEEQRDWEDNDDVFATNWLQREGILVSRDIAAVAIEHVARLISFHPVMDYVHGCEWDGVARLDTWLIDALGCEDTPYCRAISAKWLIAAVARIFQPGCKSDCALILEGPQGEGKSTALRIMFHPWFSDELAELGTKDASMQLPGKWCFEISELDAMTRADVSKIKSFMSRSADRYRPAYGHRVIEQLRQSVFCGTVNHNEYLRDETGGRRFWPVLCGAIDHELIRSTRVQVWGEARERFLGGETWWLDDDLIVASAGVQQAARRIADPWEREIRRICANLESTTASEILVDMGIPIKDQQQLHQNRATACLKAIGWKRRSVRHQGEPAYRYMPPA